jgi:asparagine N-glycosylation enzyme membrane subunit Stt3
MSNEEDDVIIDFSKVKNLFKKKENKDNSEENNRKEESDEADPNHIEIVIDKEKKESHESRRDDDSESEINLVETWDKTKKFAKKYSLVFLILLPLFLSVFLRIMPAYLPTTDEWSKNTVTNNLRNEISRQINQQYPNLPQENRNTLINQQYQAYIEANGAQLEENIRQGSQYYKDQLKDENGQTYLLAIDPYFWIYFANNILENGHPGTELRNGKPWTTKSQAPQGVEVTPEFNMYFNAYFYKFISIFNKNIDIWATTFYIPIILSSLAVIPAFFIARKRAGNLAGLVASTIVAIHPSFLARTAGGFADTDAYNVTLPLFIMWFLIEAFEAKDIKKASIFVALSTLTLALFKLAWQGWWYIYNFILASIFIYIVYLALSNLKAIKENFIGVIKKPEITKGLVVVGEFLALSTIFIALTSRGSLINTFRNILVGLPRYVVTLKDVASTTIWPNVLTTVAELNPSSISGTINGVGGRLLFLASLIGILLTLCTFQKKDVPGKQRTQELLLVSGSVLFYIYLISNVANFKSVTFLILLLLPIAIRGLMILYNKEKNIDIKYASILIIWLVGTIYGSTRGVRFIMLMVPAFAVAVGLFVGILFDLIRRLAKDHLRIDTRITTPLLLILVYVLIIGSMWTNAMATAKNEIPSMNDAWWNGLKAINMDSEEDAIITSWWDFGHWFRAIADRAVNFDGASQDTPQAHWVGKSLLTDNPDLTLGILRMLDCSRNDAYDTLITYKKPLEAIEILEKIQPLYEKNDVRAVLDEYGLTQNQAEEIIKLTHCTPPDAYYITSEDMVGKAGVWGHFGSWDFRRAEMYNRVNKANLISGTQILIDDYGYNEESARNMYYEIQNADPNQWISPWPGYVSSPSGCQKQDDVHTCVIGIQGGQAVMIFNSTAEDAFVVTPSGNLRPNSVSYVDDSGRFKYVEYKQDTVGYSFTLIANNGGYSAVMMHPLQVASTFTRLFYHNGVGMNQFEKFYEAYGITGGRVVIWKVKWNEVDQTEVSTETPIIEVEEEILDEAAEEDNLLNTTELSSPNDSNTIQ